jgi:hypothetical protein
MSSKLGLSLIGIESAQFDPDAVKFLSAAAITDTITLYAINNLVTGLKLNGLWTKMHAIYPFAGSTATTQKWNLKDPRDLDAAYRLTFSGGWTHASTGATPNGTNALASTFYTYANATTNSTHLSYYSRTTSTPNVGQSRFPVEIGNGTQGSSPVIEYNLQVASDISPNIFLISRQYSDPAQPGPQINGQIYVSNSGTTSGSQGFFIATRSSSTSHKAYKNGLQIGTTNTTTNTYTLSGSTAIQIAKGPGGSYSNRECAFASIGLGLTDAEAANFSTLVTTYLTTLQRLPAAVIVGASIGQYSLDGTTWTTVTNMPAITFRAVAWSPTLGLWAAIGTSATTAYSPNGLTWVSSTCTTSNTWNGIVWASGLSLFVAIAVVATAASTAVMTSTNGTSWTNRTATSNNNWRGLAYSPTLNRLVAVCSNGTTTTAVMTSDDGTTWTTRTTPSGGAWYAVAWSPSLSLFAALKLSSTDAMTSPDGITWTARTGANTNQWCGMAWSPKLGLFAAVSANGTLNRVQTSPDGITWTVRTTPASAEIAWNQISWSETLNLFLAVAAQGTSPQVMTSPDGTTWTTRTTSATTMIGIGAI